MGHIIAGAACPQELATMNPIRFVVCGRGCATCVCFRAFFLAGKKKKARWATDELDEADEQGSEPEQARK